MAASETTICNLALAKLGAGKIIALDEESPEAQACRLHYAETRDEVLRSHRWNFATRAQSLTENAVPPIFGWNHQFLLPTDCLRVLELNGWNLTQRPGYWQLEGRMLLCNDEAADIRYIVLPLRPAGTENWRPADLEKLVTRDSMIGVMDALPGIPQES